MKKDDERKLIKKVVLCFRVEEKRDKERREAIFKGHNPSLYPSSGLYEEALPDYILATGFEWVVISIGCYGCSVQEMPPFTQSMINSLILNIDSAYGISLFDFKEDGAFKNRIIIQQSLNKQSEEQIGIFITKLIQSNIGVVLMDSCGAFSTLDHFNCIKRNLDQYGKKLLVIESYFNENQVAILQKQLFEKVSKANELESIMKKIHAQDKSDIEGCVIFDHISRLNSFEQLIACANSTLVSPLSSPSSSTTKPLENYDFLTRFYNWIIEVLHRIWESMKRGAHQCGFFANQERDETLISSDNTLTVV